MTVRDHWDSVYRSKAPDEVSWYQESPTTSLELIAASSVERTAPIIDVGAGASNLIDALLAKGCTDVTALDVSAAALEVTKARVGASAPVEWIAADLLEWTPSRRYALWHDRAVFHFLAPDQQPAYRALLLEALAPGGVAILGTFAEDGPESCSGLAVTRSSVADLVTFLGPEFLAFDTRSEHHATPWGAAQSFAWVAARRVDAAP